MKKSIRIVLPVLTILSLTGCSSSYRDLGKIQDSQKLIVATNAEFAPFEYIENNQYVGLDMDIARAYADYLSVDCHIVNQDFDAALIAVSKGKADIAIAAITKNAKREQTMSFSSSYYSASQVVIVKKDSYYASIVDKEEILTALKNDHAKIGVQRGTTGQYYVEGDPDWDFEGIAGTTCVSYDNGGLAVTALANGQIQAVIVDIAPAEYYCKNNDAILFQPQIILTEEEYAIAVAKGNESLLVSINQFIEEIKENGKYEEIVNQYFGN